MGKNLKILIVVLLVFPCVVLFSACYLFKDLPDDSAPKISAGTYRFESFTLTMPDSDVVFIGDSLTTFIATITNVYSSSEPTLDPEFEGDDGMDSEEIVESLSALARGSLIIQDYHISFSEGTMHLVTTSYYIEDNGEISLQREIIALEEFDDVSYRYENGKIIINIDVGFLEMVFGKD